ncbi:MAG: hypothetical protein SW019_00175 [Actinomycetota bacterium]|nr:hypothetical protein [Actinomycetota bacterium]
MTTALQGWLNHSPFDPRHLKAVLRDMWQELTADEPGAGADEPAPQLMGRGLERC